MSTACRCGPTRTVPPTYTGPPEAPADTGPPAAPAGPDEDAAARRLAEPGGPAEIYGSAEQVAQITEPNIARWWEDFKPAPYTQPEWEWANKAELWDAVTSAVWDDATARYGERIHPRIATVWPGGGNVSANAVWSWSSHVQSGGYGHLGLARVGLTPDDPEQQRVDLAVYWLQIKVTATDDPTRFVGELHKVLDPFPMPGTIVWTGDDGGEVADYLRTQPDVSDDDFDLIQEDWPMERKAPLIVALTAIWLIMSLGLGQDTSRAATRTPTEASDQPSGPRDPGGEEPISSECWGVSCDRVAACEAITNATDCREAVQAGAERPGNRRAVVCTGEEALGSPQQVCATGEPDPPEPDDPGEGRTTRITRVDEQPCDAPTVAPQPELVDFPPQRVRLNPDVGLTGLDTWLWATGDPTYSWVHTTTGEVRRVTYAQDGTLGEDGSVDWGPEYVLADQRWDCARAASYGARITQWRWTLEQTAGGTRHHTATSDRQGYQPDHRGDGREASARIMLETKGSYRVDLETVWEGDWGATWTASSTPVDYQVIEIRARLLPSSP